MNLKKDIVIKKQRILIKVYLRKKLDDLKCGRLPKWGWSINASYYVSTDPDIYIKDDFSLYYNPKTFFIKEALIKKTLKDLRKEDKIEYLRRILRAKLDIISGKDCFIPESVYWHIDTVDVGCNIYEIFARLDFKVYAKEVNFLN